MKMMRVGATDGLRLRSNPDVSASVIRVLAHDERVTLLDEPAVHHSYIQWVHLQTFRNETGWAALDYLVSEPAPPTMLLDVPYHSQEDVDARHFRNDCGPACLAMWIDFVQDGRRVTVDEISARSPLGQRDDGLLSEQLVALGGQFNLKLKVNRTPSLGLIRSELDQGRPVIALIWYKVLTARQSPYGGGHFVMVVGYSPDSLWLNDPDWYGNRRKEGYQWRVPVQQFSRALRQVIVWQ
jgi:hypothetical protein